LKWVGEKDRGGKNQLTQLINRLLGQIQGDTTTTIFAELQVSIKSHRGVKDDDQVFSRTEDAQWTWNWSHIGYLTFWLSKSKTYASGQNGFKLDCACVKSIWLWIEFLQRKEIRMSGNPFCDQKPVQMI